MAKTALYNVLLIWQFPPPKPFILLTSLSNISATCYPVLEEEGPKVLQKEKVSPFFTI